MIASLPSKSISISLKFRRMNFTNRVAVLWINKYMVRYYQGYMHPKTLLKRKTSLPTFAAIWSPPPGGVKRESRSNRELSP